MTYGAIRYEKRGEIGWITLCRPEEANAINSQMSRELHQACQEMAGNENILVVVIMGAGEVFSCGEDGEEFRESWERGNIIREERKRLMQEFGISEKIARIDRPVIAAINGDALGQGLELTLACDLRIASQAAHFGFPHLGSGVIPRDGGTQRLPRIIGRGKALEMLLTAELIDAQEALRVGLIHQVVPSSEVAMAAEKLASKLASRAPVAVRYAKEAINKGLDLTLEQGLRLEADLYLILQTTEDRSEGVAAFLEKRAPRFQGR